MYLYVPCVFQACESCASVSALWKAAPPPPEQHPVLSGPGGLPLYPPQLRARRPFLQAFTGSRSYLRLMGHVVLASAATLVIFEAALRLLFLWARGPNPQPVGRICPPLQRWVFRKR